MYYIWYCYFYSPIAFTSYVQYVCAIVFKIIFWNDPTAVTVSLRAYICLQGRGSWKNWSYYTYVLNWWPQTNVVEYFLCIVPATYTKASPSARKMLLFSSIIITIILFYAITRIYAISHIYLEVSETEGLVELHWVIGLSVLGKFNLIYFYIIQYTNVLSRILMCFQESKFS